MDIGINLFGYDSETKISVDRQIELMKKYGFKKTFMISDSPAANDETVKKLNDAGISLATFHAPFGKINTIWAEGSEGDAMLQAFLDGVEKCAKYGAPVLVVHLSSKFPAPRISEVGIARFEKLMNYARLNGVKIAFENQRCLGNLAYVMELFDDAGFCWDVGHEACFCAGREFMPIFGDRLLTVHLHDNFGVYDQDLHLLPYDGKLDYDRVTTRLAKANYRDCIMLEVFRASSNEYDNITDEQYYAKAAERANRIKTELEAKLKQE